MGFSKGQAVNTIYGVGFIKEKRDNLYVVLLKNWKLAQVGLVHRPCFLHAVGCSNSTNAFSLCLALLYCLAYRGCVS